MLTYFNRWYIEILQENNSKIRVGILEIYKNNTIDDIMTTQAVEKKKNSKNV